MKYRKHRIEISYKSYSGISNDLTREVYSYLILMSRLIIQYDIYKGNKVICYLKYKEKFSDVEYEWKKELCTSNITINT